MGREARAMKSKKWQMKANPSECRICNICQMVCSLKQDKTFNPNKSYIGISSNIKPSGELDVGIYFSDECDSCGLCAKYCVYGALSREKLPEVEAKS